MYKLFVPSPDSHWRRTLATISGPLSDLMKVGTVETHPTLTPPETEGIALIMLVYQPFRGVAVGRETQLRKF